MGSWEMRQRETNQLTARKLRELADALEKDEALVQNWAEENTLEERWVGSYPERVDIGGRTFTLHYQWLHRHART